MARSNEPLWWGPFSAGMMADALFIPALIVLTGFLLPGSTEPNAALRVQNLINAPLTRIFLVVVISLSFFHWAHRFRYLVFDLGIKGGKGLIACLCYGTAIAGTLIAAGIALRVI
jgi:fumarate reductase subunit D